MAWDEQTIQVEILAEFRDQAAIGYRAEKLSGYGVYLPQPPREACAKINPLPRQHTCKECGESFGSPHGLESHTILKHRGRMPELGERRKRGRGKPLTWRKHEYQCDDCPLDFGTAVGLRSHCLATGHMRARLFELESQAIRAGRRLIPFMAEVCRRSPSEAA